MDRRINTGGAVGSLRRRAEEVALLQPNPAHVVLETGLPAWVAETLHELRVHQVELELQNEELRRVQVELDASRDRYFALFDLAPVGYFTLNGEGLILEANFTGARLLGTDRQALVNLPLTRFIHPSDQDAFYLFRKSLLESGAPRALELRVLTPAGVCFEARLESSLDEGALDQRATMLVLSDITEHRRMEALLHQSLKMDSLAILAGGVAHDMNNVLGAILGLASVHVEIQPPGSSAQAAFETITRACDRGSQLIRSLMNFARPALTDAQTVDVNELIRNEVGLVLRTTLSQLQLELDLAEDLLPIQGDSPLLINALVNLCLNAAEAMPQTGRLTLRSRNVGQAEIELQVEDAGTGMSPEVLEKALNPFFTTKAHGQGLGMGLSVAHSTVLAHQGVMELLSQPGQGTRVLIRFPANQPRLASQAVPSGPIPAKAPAPGNLQVLLVDDDELVQHSMRMILEILGHSVTIASSGEEALAKLEGGYAPGVVILDMNMPGLGGAGTLPRLRALRPDLPVVIATGRTNQAVLDLLATYPKVTQLPKPFGIQDIRRHLGQLGQR